MSTVKLRPNQILTLAVGYLKFPRQKLGAEQILEVAADGDLLVACSQLTAETRGFINASVFAAMKPNAVLINVARGQELDEDALVEAVTAGRIRGAVLNVNAGEPAGRPPRPELAGLPRSC